MDIEVVSSVVFQLVGLLAIVGLAAVAAWGIICDVRLRRTTSVELRSERCERCTGDVSPCYVDGLGIGAAVLIKRNGRTGEIRQILLDGQQPQYEVRYVDLNQFVTNSWFVAAELQLELQPFDDREAAHAEFSTPWDAMLDEANRA